MSQRIQLNRRAMMTRVEMEGTRMSKELSRRRVPFLLNPGNTRRIIPRGDIFITERRTGSKTMSTETSEVFRIRPASRGNKNGVTSG